MEKIIAQERANHEKDLEAEKKKTDVALNKLVSMLGIKFNCFVS